MKPICNLCGKEIVPGEPCESILVKLQKSDVDKIFDRVMKTPVESIMLLEAAAKDLREIADTLEQIKEDVDNDELNESFAHSTSMRLRVITKKVDDEIKRLIK